MNNLKSFPLDTKTIQPQFKSTAEFVVFDRKPIGSKPIKSFADDAENTESVRLSVNSNSVARFLTAISLIMVLASCASLMADYLTGNRSLLIHKVVKLLYVDLELNVPAFFSMTLLLFSSLLLAFITVLKKRQKAPHVFYWAVLAGGFLFMAFDEIVSVHERLIEPMRAVLGENRHLGILYFAWVVPAIGLISFLAIFFLKFLWSLPLKTRITFIVAAGLYLGAAVGLEFVEGNFTEIYGKENLTYMILTTVEETFEMLGTVLFIWALLEYIARHFKEARLRFSSFAG